MSITTANEFKTWLKSHPNSHIRSLFVILKNIRSFQLPTPKIFNKFIYLVHQIIQSSFATIIRILYATPAFKGRTNQCGKNLYLYGGVPFISGPIVINVGHQCRISGHTTFTGCSMIKQSILSIGNNVDIGWQTTIAVGHNVTIEDNVRIAGGACLFGYSGHPLDAYRRAIGDGDDPSQISDIILKRDVWLGRGVTVKGGVTIGEGSVIAAGSVVTKDIPPFTIAAGNPAKVVASIPVSKSTQNLAGGRYV